MSELPTTVKPSGFWRRTLSREERGQILPIVFAVVLELGTDSGALGGRYNARHRYRKCSTVSISNALAIVVNGFDIVLCAGLRANAALLEY